MATEKFSLYERDKARLRGTAFEQPEEDEAELTPEEYDQLYQELYPDETIEIPEDTNPTLLNNSEPVTQSDKKSPTGPVVEDPTPDEYDQIFESHFMQAGEDEQQELIRMDTPDEHGVTPREYGEIAVQLDPKEGMEINLSGLTVERVFENNPEWRESLIPGPDGLEYAWDVTKAIVEGVGNALIDTVNFIVSPIQKQEDLYSKVLERDTNNIYIGEMDFDLDTKPGEIVSTISEYLTGYLLTAPINGLRNPLAVSNTAYRYVLDNVIRSSAGDFLVANREDQTITGMMFPESDNPIVQALRIDPEDSELSAKAAIAAEGVMFATALSGAFDVGKWSYLTWKGQPTKDALDVFFENSEDLFNPSHKYNLDLADQQRAHTVEWKQQNIPTGQQLMDDMQVHMLGIDKQLDEIDKAREIYRARTEELPFKERMKARTETKNFLNVAQKDLKKIEEQIKPITQQIDSVVRELQGMYDFAEGIGGIKGIVDDIPAEKAVEEATEASRKATKPGEVFEPGLHKVPEGTLLPERPLVPEIGTEWIDKVQNLRSQLRRREEELARVLDNHRATSDNIIESKYFLKEIADEVQLNAAIRKGLAIRLDLTPRYKAVDFLEEGPILGKISDDELAKLRVQHKVDGKFTLFSTDGMKFSRVAKNTQRGAAAKMLGKTPAIEDVSSIGRTMDTRPQPSTVNDALVEDLFFKQRGTSVPDKILNVVRDIGSTLWYRSTDRLKSLAEVSPTAGKLANTLRHDAVHMGPEAGQYSYTESTQYMIGKFSTKLRDAFAQLDNSNKTYRGKLTDDANDRIWNWLNGVSREELPEDMLGVAREVRGILDEFLAQSPEKSAYIKDFFPRQINKRALFKNEDEFRRLLAGDGYVDKVRQDDIIQKLLDEADADLGITPRKADDRRFGMRGSKILSGGSRTLDLSIDRYKKFYNTNVLDALTKYIERGSGKITYAQLFGYGGEKVETMLEQILKESKEAGRPIRNDEVAAISRILQNIQGLRKLDVRSVKVGGATVKLDPNVAQEGIATAMRVMLLHMATLSSLGEAFIPFSKARLRDSVGGLMQATAAVPKHYFGKVLRNTPEARSYEAAQAVGLATDTAAASRLNAMLGGSEIMSSAMQKVNNVNFVTNLLSEWVKFVQVSAFHTGRLKAINNLKAIEKRGPKSVIAQHRGKELIEMGISIDEGLAWLKRGASQKDPFYTQIQRGALRFTDSTVIHPDSTVRPAIQNSPEFLLLTQLKAYPVAFSNIVLRDWGEGIFRPWVNISQDIASGDLTKETFKAEAFSSASKAARVATVIPLMYAATEAGLMIKDIIKWGPDGNPEAPAEEGMDHMLRVLDTSGMLGHSATVHHAFQADKFSQDPIYSWLGPAPSIGLRTVGGAIEELSGDEGKLRDALAKEAANLTRLPLPAEIIWSIATPDGTEDWRKNFRKWLSSPEIAPEDFDPFEHLPEDLSPLNFTDWSPMNFVRDWFYPDMTLEELQKMSEEDREEQILLEDFKSSEDTSEEKSERLRELLRQKYSTGKVTVSPKPMVTPEDGDDDTR
jgi:hypothetical protein